MREWIPIPGTAKARLVDAAIRQFGVKGFDGVNVVELAAEAGVTTGSLYHHFTSKLGLYLLVRDEMEKRMVERMEGAAAAVGGKGRPAVGAALLVSFDAAVRFGVTRVLSERRPDDAPDAIEGVLRGLLPRAVRAAAAMLAAGWRGALAAVADGTSPAAARAGLAWLLEGDGG
ncbi:MAG: TetR/AcrR family transcriptional regulator [Acidimicrobiales bacterium]